MKPGISAVVASVVLMVAGSSLAGAMTEGYSEHDEQARAVLESVSWEAPTIVEVVLGDHAFLPNEILLPLGKPVILRLRNTGNVGHDMVGGSIFQAVLIKHVGTDAGRVVTPYIQSVFIRTRQNTDIWLLPLRAGTFSFFCGIGGHRESGMEGTITIR